MMKHFYLILLLLPSIIVAQSPEKLKKKGDYTGALLKYVTNISKKPQKKGPRKVFAKNYAELTRSIDEHFLHYRTLADSFIGDPTVEQAYRLKGDYETYMRAKAVWDALEIETLSLKKEKIPVDLLDLKDSLFAINYRISELKISASRMHDKQGDYHGSFSDREHLIAAAQEYKRAASYTPKNEEIWEKYSRVCKAATIRIVLLPLNNKTRLTNVGDIGSTFSSSVIEKLNQDKEVMEFLELISEAEIRQILSQAQQAYSSNLSQSDITQLRDKLEADAVWYGSFNQLIQEQPSINTSDPTVTKSRVKVGTKKEWQEGKNGKPGREVEVDVYEDRTATYTTTTECYTLTLTGSYIIRNEASNTKTFSEKNTTCTSWTNMLNGHAEVYKNVRKKKTNIASIQVRIASIIDALSTKFYNEIKQQVISRKYPVITRLSQLQTNP